MKEENKFIARRLKSIRKSMSMSQMEFAKAAGISQAAIAAYEIGKKCPSVISAMKIAKAFGLSLDTLCCMPSFVDDRLKEIDEIMEKLTEEKMELIKKWHKSE